MRQAVVQSSPDPGAVGCAKSEAAPRLWDHRPGCLRSRFRSWLAAGIAAVAAIPGCASPTSPIAPLTPGSSSPSLILVLVDGLTLEDLERTDLQNLSNFAANSRIALMSTPVAGEKSDLAAMLALALGEPAVVEPSDDSAYMTYEGHSEGDTAAEVFRRRTGEIANSENKPDFAFPNSGSAVHLGIASLSRRGLSSKLITAQIRRHGGIRVAGAGNADADTPHRPIGLMISDSGGKIDSAHVGRESIDRDARAPYSRRDSPERLAAWALQTADADLVALHLGDLARLDTIRSSLTEPEYLSLREVALGGIDRLLSSLNSRAKPRGLKPRVFLVSTRPKIEADGRWARLSVVALGRLNGEKQGGLLTSATTRTNGLISNIDITPTVLAGLGVSQPAHMTGHPVEAVAGSTSELKRIDSLTQVNGFGLVPVFVLLGAIAALTVLIGLLALRFGWATIVPAVILLVLSNFPLAMLLVVPVNPRTVIELGAYTIFIMAFLALLELAGARILSRRSLETSITQWAVGLLAAGTVAVILLDTLAGQQWIKYSMFSGYQLSGVRFYGIGNEYMGVLVGMALLLAFVADLTMKASAALFGLCAVVLGLPIFGADAGGFVGAVVAFGAALFIKRTGRVHWAAVIVLSVLGFAIAFLIAFAEQALSGAESSHLGGAIAAAQKEGWGALGAIIQRKIAMNARILLNPYMLTAIAAASAVILAMQGPLRAWLESLLEAYPSWARGLPSAGWGALAAFLFNDSGAVAAIFVIGGFLASGLILLFSLGPANPSRNAETVLES